MRARTAGLLACALLSSSGMEAAAAIVKDMDRKFPVGKYCPVESRTAAGGDVAFVAPAGTIRLTFSGDNQVGSGNHNAFRIDNVAVVLKTVFDAHLLVSPGFDDCYNPFPPPGQATGGMLNAPSYDFNAAGTPEVFLDLFPTGISGWTGAFATFNATSSAPTTPANPGPPPFTGGSLNLGLASDGAVQVHASRIISGLTPGQTYVVAFWWFAQETGRLRVTIGVPCPDGDGDGFILCSGGCDAALGQTCGDCNDANNHCGTACNDIDADGWCTPFDCDDTAATCTSNCGPDVDADFVPDCKDGCLDADGDRYGNAGGLGNTCLGADCNPANRFCNVSCVDGDGDTHCAPGDCQDGNPSVGNLLPEVNDFQDQNCPGDDGFGVVDEVSLNAGFLTAGNKNLYGWTHQTAAANYLAVRSGTRTFPAGCTSFPTSGNTWTDAATPAVGQLFYYMVRPETPSRGSWGQGPAAAERAAVCGAESDCDNGVNDDGDGATDCADTDCANTAACRAATFTFVETTGNDIADNALQLFFQGVTAGASDHIFFEIQEIGRTVAWCSVNAGFYKTQYLALAPTFGTISSGSWQKWRKAPSTGNAWTGPDTAAHVNTFGNDCFGDYSWCSEQWSPEPQNAIFPDRTNDCEIYDMATGGCQGGAWRLTIKIAGTRAAACGF